MLSGTPHSRGFLYIGEGRLMAAVLGHSLTCGNLDSGIRRNDGNWQPPSSHSAIAREAVIIPKEYKWEVCSGWFRYSGI